MPQPTTQICVFNTTTNVIDITTGAAIGPSVAGTPVILNSQGIVDPTLVGIGIQAVAGENLLPGNLVNLYNSGGTLTVQLAYGAAIGIAPSGATYPVLAAGYVNATTAIGNTVSVSFVGPFFYIDNNSEFSSSSIGKEVYLSATVKGGITLTRPSGIGQADQSVGYVLSYDATTHTVGVEYISAFNDFSRISGIAQISQGGTGASTASQALINLFGTFSPATFWAGPVSGSPASPTARAIVNTDLSGAIFGGSGASHSAGAVPDPGAVASPLRFLREDATWAVVNEATSSDNPTETTSLGPVTLLASVPTSACYMVSVYEECTVVGASGGGQPFGSGVFGSGIFNMGDDSVQTSVNWTDDSGVRYATPVPNPLDLAGLNAASGSLFIRAKSGTAITFTSALAATGSPTYGVFVRLEPMG